MDEGWICFRRYLQKPRLAMFHVLLYSTALNYLDGFSVHCLLCYFSFTVPCLMLYLLFWKAFVPYSNSSLLLF
jgi:hypothetical protein